MAVETFPQVPAGSIAAIVTVLAMGAPAPPRAERADPAWSLCAVPSPEPAFYLDLYRRVGAPHLWYSRLETSADELAAILGDPAIVLHALFVEGRAEGMVELDLRQPGACEITFFGVTPGLIGTGAARLMMNRAIATAFSHGIERLWLHTNTLDHPRALDFYRRSGFTPVERRIEIAADPRLSGLLPRGSAPDVPIL